MRAIITGHSAGLGAALSAALLERDFRVLGLSRRSCEPLRTRFGNHLHEWHLDLADPEALGNLLSGPDWQTFCATDETILLINNAGVLQPIDPVGQQGAERIARAVAVNVTAPLVLTDAFEASTRRSPDRRVMHISSGAARTAYAGWSIYCATKAALDHHARAIREDGREGLRIASVAPGVIDTGMQDQIRAVEADRFPSVERFRRLKSDGHLQTPEASAARLVGYLLGEGYGSEAVMDIRDLG